MMQAAAANKHKTALAQNGRISPRTLNLSSLTLLPEKENPIMKVDNLVGCGGETSGFCVVCLPAFLLVGIRRASAIFAPVVFAFLASASFLAEEAGPLGGAMR